MTDPLKAWLAVLANLYGPYRAEAASVFSTYAPMLRREFPAEAFTDKSALHVARTCPSTPTFGKLSEALAEWWRDNRPQAPRLAAPRAEAWPKDTMTADQLAACVASVKAKYGPIKPPEPERADNQPRIKPRYLNSDELAAARAVQGIRLPARAE